MNLQQFISTNNGEAVTYDNIKVNYGQCEQLVCLYWKELYGFNCPPIPYAYLLWTNPTVLAAFEQIPIGQEQPGDVAVFGRSTLINSPEAGHTDIVVQGQTGGGFLGFDSNWGTTATTNYQVISGVKYPAAHEVQHTYSDVLGFLRYKGEETMDRGVMGAMKFLAVRQTGDITDAEYSTYKNDLAGWVQYLTRVQAEHNIAPQTYPPLPRAAMDTYKTVATRQTVTDDEYTKFNDDVPGFANYLLEVQKEHNIEPIAE